MADQIKATPRNRIFGLLADGVHGFNDFGSMPFGYNNPPVNALLGLLGVPAIANTLDRLSYGEPLTTGAGMTMRPRPEAVDAAMTAMPVVQGVNKFAMLAGRAGERFAEKVVPKVMERGGFGAGLLSDLSRGTTSNMIKTPAGQIPETRADVNKLADRLGRLLDDAGVKYQSDKSGLSPARYFTFDLPPSATHTAEDIASYGPEKFKARISDHVNVHGATFSVDPHTGSTFEQLLQSVRDAGIPLANKVRPQSKVQTRQSPFFGTKASEVNALRQSRGGAPLTPNEIISMGLVDDLGLTNK